MKSIARKFTPVVLALLLAACGSGGPGLEQTTQLSTDSRLQGYISAFTDTCLRNAPSFDEQAVSAAFLRAPVAGALLTATPDKNCRVYVNSYGQESARPTQGDLNAMAGVLQSQVGGSARWVNSSIRVASNSGEYTLFAQPTAKGELILSVYK